MRFRRSLAVGVTAAAAATLAPAATGAAPAAADGGGIVDSNICALTNLLGAVAPDAPCGQSAGDLQLVPTPVQDQQPQQPAQDQQTQQPVQNQQPQQPTQDQQTQQPAQNQQPQEPNSANVPQQPADTTATDTTGTDTGADTTGTDTGADTTGTDTTGTDTGTDTTQQNPQQPQQNPQQPQQNPDAPADTAPDTVVAKPPATSSRPDATTQQPASQQAATSQQPSCAAQDSGDFPIDTRINKGPTTYHPGGGFQNWSIDLTNTTDDTCGNIHPILVLVDQRKTLRPQQPQLEFFDGSRWRPVPFERTDQDENIGVFDDGFPGFSVAPGETVTVKVRLSFTSDTQPNQVVATAAVVQRRDDDGDWVGQSNDYPFTIVGADGAQPPRADRPGELAQTGPGSLLGLGVTAGAFLLGGGALVVGSRRLRVRRR